MSQYQDAHLKKCAAARRYIILCSFPAECLLSDDDEEEESEDEDSDSEDETSLEEEEDEEGELSLEDVTIAQKAKQQQHLLNSIKLEEEEEEFYDATAASKQAQQTALQTASAPNATNSDIDAATEAAKAIMELMKKSTYLVGCTAVE